MEKKRLKALVEGLLFVSGDEGMSVRKIAKITEESESTVLNVLNELIEDYKHESRGMTIMKSNDVYHLTTKREHSLYYKKLLQNPQTSRLSQAMLETVAIIAYKQPVTRVEIEHIRGVKSEYAIQTLLARSLIEEVGRKNTIGRPILYGTTKEFLTYFGLTSLEELPPLPEKQDVNERDENVDLFLSQFKETEKE